MAVVYRATNKINHKTYIGKSVNFEDRKYSHIYKAKKGLKKSRFACAILHYGASNFDWEILVSNVSNEEALKKEIEFIELYKPEYNLTKGGEGTSGLIFTDEHRRKISEAQLGTKRPKEVCDKISKNNWAKTQMKGIKVCDEIKLKISISCTGKKYPNRKMPKQSEETKQKRIESLRNFYKNKRQSC